ncbi:MAG TPA: Ig-like domain-containing protein, partial [Myxococcales bacterium]|nr:Ig-like domain-containing protein [Myxococcales bacterium]
MHRIRISRSVALVAVCLAACTQVATDPTQPSTPTATSTDEQHLIALNGYPVDTQYPEQTYSQLPSSLRTSTLSNAIRQGTAPAGGLYLIQLKGAVTDDALAAIRATGVELVSYVPYNAYVIRASSTAAAALVAAKLPAVQFMGDYEPGFRLSPELRQNVRSMLADKVDVTVQVVDGPTARATIDTLAAMALSLDSTHQVGSFHNVKLTVNPLMLDSIASMRDVFGLEERTQKRILDEAQGQIVAGNVTPGGFANPPGYLSWLASKGFTSSQFTSFSVEVADDTYTLAGHPDLPSARIAFQNNPTSQTGVLGGHGFLNSHIIGGFNNGTGTTLEDSRGHNYGLGIAPFAKVGITAIFGTGSSTPTAWENTAYGQGARISSNSWGFTGAAAKKYDTNAQEFDRIVRDAQSGTTGNQQMMVVFAAGNDGSAANTVSSPATAKNVLTAGASENDRQTGSDGCAVANTGADNANDVINFSSRGPVNATGGDGRVKPDLMAPGTHIEAGIPQSNYDGSSVCNQYWPSGQTLYGWSSGTSHSCPALAGGAALVYQDFLNKSLPAPSPAMTKAVLMGSATYMIGTGANDTLPSNNQGMGRVNLGLAFDSVQRILVDQTQVLGATGQTYQATGTIVDTSKPFRVVLAWTDAAGPTTGAPWVNNLDLEVTVNGTFSSTYKGNVFSQDMSVTGGAADTKNNVESVFLPAGVSGSFVITVKATNIAGDGVPGNADTTDQDFALLVYNGSSGAVSPTIGVSPSSFTFNGAVGGANPANQTLSISNTGGGTLSWSASTSASWLSLLPTTGTAPSSTILSVNTSGMAAGTYNGTVTVTATGATNSPVSVPVTLTLTAPDTIPPTTSITAPASGAAVSGNVTITASASDNVGVTNVLFFVDGVQVGSDSTSPYSITWSSTTVGNGSHSINSQAFDAAGNSGTSAFVGVTVSNTSSTAVYDATLKAPKCATAGTACDSGASLVLGRAALGPEPSQPNTINNSCADGTSGTFHSDESVDQVTVTSVDGTTFAAGKQVRIDVKVWAYTSFSSDHLDLYYAADASAPSWTFIGTVNPTAGGAQTLSATYTLPSGGSLQAVRAAFRYTGAASACSTGAYDDRDDLIFAVNAGAPDTTPPTVSITAPTAGSTVSGTVTISASASDNVGVSRVEFYVDGGLLSSDTTSPYSASWNTAAASNGAHTLTAKAFDAAGNNTTSAAVGVTVSNTSSELVVNGGFEGSSSP